MCQLFYFHAFFTYFSSFDMEMYIISLNCKSENSWKEKKNAKKKKWWFSLFKYLQISIVVWLAN